MFVQGALTMIVLGVHTQHHIPLQSKFNLVMS